MEPTPLSPEVAARTLPRWVYLGIMGVMVLVSTVVIAANGNISIMDDPIVTWYIIDVLTFRDEGVSLFY